jgi:hypothetical protein
MSSVTLTQLVLCYDVGETQTETPSASYFNEYVSPFAEPSTPQKPLSNKQEDWSVIRKLGRVLTFGIGNTTEVFHIPGNSELTKI